MEGRSRTENKKDFMVSAGRLFRSFFLPLFVGLTTLLNLIVDGRMKGEGVAPEEQVRASKYKLEKVRKA